MDAALGVIGVGGREGAMKDSERHIDFAAKMPECGERKFCIQRITQKFGADVAILFGALFYERTKPGRQVDVPLLINADGAGDEELGIRPEPQTDLGPRGRSEQGKHVRITPQNAKASAGSCQAIEQSLERIIRAIKEYYFEQGGVERIEAESCGNGA
jgi:hypothetical protein